MEGHLLALFRRAAVLARPELAPVRAYLAAAGSERDALDRRSCQLAAELAQLFDEYAASRPICWAWLDDQPTAVGAGVRARAVAARLWLAVVRPGGRLADESRRSKRRILPLEALFGEAMRRTPAPWAGATLHVFGVSYIATAYRRMFAALACQADVRIYTLTPVAKTSAFSPADRTCDGRNPLACKRTRTNARLWARRGRENLHLLSALPGTTVDARFADHANEAPTLLGVCRATSSIRVRLRASLPCEPDNSLRVFPCPSMRRELEWSPPRFGVSSARNRRCASTTLRWSCPKRARTSS